MSAPRVVTRLAWRELRARPWRTALVAALVAVPVAGMVVATVFVRSSADLGYMWSRHADLAVWDQGGPTGSAVPLDVEKVLTGAESAHIDQGYARVRTVDGRRAELDVHAGDVDHRLADGLLHVLSGRLPRAPSEVALSPSARSRLGVDVGETLELDRPAITVTVVGSVVRPWSYNGALAVFAEPPDEIRPALWGGATYVGLGADATEDDVARALAALREAGFAGEKQLARRSHDSKQDDVNWTYVIGSLVLLVVGIVIAAAFAVGARRQLHTLGMLAGNGAERGDIRSLLLVEGALCGAAGVAAGVVLAGALLVAGAPHRNRLLDQVTDGWVVRLEDLVPIALLGIAATVIAAVQPARSASRVSVLQALAGQRPSGPVPGWLPSVGVVVFVGGLCLLALAVFGAAGGSGDGGAVWTLTAILGGVAVVLGTTACVPALVARLEPLAARLRGTLRLSARSLARQRSRASGIVAAISASGTLAIVASAVVLSTSADEHGIVQRLPEDVVAIWTSPGLDDDRPAADIDEDTVRRVVDLIGPAERADFHLLNAGLTTTETMFTPFGNMNIAVADDDLVDFLEVDERGRAALSDGAVVVLDPTVEQGEHAATLQKYPTFDERGEHEVTPPATVPVRAVVIDPDEPLTWDMPNVLVPESVVAELGVVRLNERVLLRAEDDLDADIEERLRDVRDELADDAAWASFGPVGSEITWNERSDTPVVMLQTVFAGLALCFTLLVVAIGLGLAAAEGRAERDVLVAVGAPPRTLSRLAGTKAAVLAVVGGVVALPTAMLPVWVWTKASSPDETLVVPWFAITLLLIGVPLVAGLATAACSAIATRARPVHASAFTAE